MHWWGNRPEVRIRVSRGNAATQFWSHPDQRRITVPVKRVTQSSFAAWLAGERAFHAGDLAHRPRPAYYPKGPERRAPVRGSGQRVRTFGSDADGACKPSCTKG